MQEFLLHGGEWYDGKQDKMRVYGEVYRYHAGKREWTHILIPNRQGMHVLHCSRHAGPDDSRY